MKLACLYLDDLVAIPGWVRQLGGTNVARENTFVASDGWVIERVADRVFTVFAEGMDAPVRIEGYGASYVVAEPMLVEPKPRKVRKPEAAA